MALTPGEFAAGMRSLARDIQADHFDEAQQEMAALGRDEVAQNFRDEQDADGNQWAARKDNQTHPLLRETYSMHAAATVEGAPGSIERRGRDQLQFGVDGSVIEHAAAHQYGTIHMPARQYMYVRRTNLSRLGEPLRDAVKRRIGLRTRKA